tara:strand:- start:19041 stop:19223 length:183 start_codon:yes stop_codon:yes gene_type:complete
MYFPSLFHLVKYQYCTNLSSINKNILPLKAKNHELIIQISIHIVYFVETDILGTKQIVTN